MKMSRLRSALPRLAALLALAAAPLAPLPARAAAAPKVITIGSLYASTGPFAAISMPTYDGLKLWVDRTNAAGGAYVKAFHRKIPLKLVSYDDQSNTATVATLTNQLITQDHVDLLVADQGSVLTSVAVPIAREHKMFLFNPGGTGAPLFSKDNPYIALLGGPASTIWPKYLADFLNAEGPAHGLHRVAILYSTNDFTGTQAASVRRFLTEAGKVKIVYDQGVPTSTSNYTVLINNIEATHPDAVLEFGYPGNDIAFLRGLQGVGQHFPFVFTLYAGLETQGLAKSVGAAGLTGVFSYVTGADYPYKVTVGLDLAQYRRVWAETYAHTPGAPFGENAVIGYVVGEMLGQTLAHTDSLDQLALRKALFSLSGRMVTMAGPFKLDAMGAQTGEITPLGQVEPDGTGRLHLVVVYPRALATGQPVIGK
jgi:branched-chain amino acid transport system substrate-binding protein